MRPDWWICRSTGPGLQLGFRRTWKEPRYDGSKYGVNCLRFAKILVHDLPCTFKAPLLYVFRNNNLECMMAWSCATFTFGIKTWTVHHVHQLIESWLTRNLYIPHSAENPRTSKKYDPGLILCHLCTQYHCAYLNIDWRTLSRQNTNRLNSMYI